MKVSVNDNEKYEKVLNITVPWNMIEDDYSDILKRYSKLSFKGFRPGKAPAGAIESFFKSQIKGDLLSVASTRLCRKALKDNDLVAGSAIELSDSELLKNDSLRFKASFIEMPQFDLPDYHQLDLQEKDLELQLDEISEKLLERTEIPLHSSFIENELKYSESSGDTASEEETEAAENRVKLMLILKKIADQDNIEISEKEIEDRIAAIAEENEIIPDQLREYLISNNGFHRLTDSLLAESVLNYIIEIQGE